MGSSLACRKPKEVGLAAELWTLASRVGYVRTHAQECGFARLARAGKAAVWRILDAHELKPHRVSYYLQRRDAEFDRKMVEVLMVYRDVNIYRAEAVHDARVQPIYTVSVDEKPGVQALGTSAPDLPPVPGKHVSVGRDHEYVRHGTLLIMAVRDLHTSEVIANVEARHRSREFIGLLQRLQERYPPEATHSRRTGQPQRAHLKGNDGMACHAPQALRVRSYAQARLVAQSGGVRVLEDDTHVSTHIRVTSLNELKQPILQGLTKRDGGSPTLLYSSPDSVPGAFHLVHLGCRPLGGAGLLLTDMAAVAPEAHTTPKCLGLSNDGTSHCLEARHGLRAPTQRGAHCDATSPRCASNVHSGRLGCPRPAAARGKLVADLGDCACLPARSLPAAAPRRRAHLLHRLGTGRHHGR